MLKLSLFFLGITIFFSSYGQVAQTSNNFFVAKEFSKDIALYNAKSFVMNSVLGNSDAVIKFEIDPLAATSSGELTSLVYQCSDMNKEGLIFGFYGTRWNDAGVVYQSYAFKNIESDKAKEMLEKIEKVIDDNSKYLNKDEGTDNVYFHFDDITFLIYKDGSTRIRVFWNGFDSEWQMIAFKRTKNRLYKKLD